MIGGVTKCRVTDWWSDGARTQHDIVVVPVADAENVGCDTIPVVDGDDDGDDDDDDDDDDNDDDDDDDDDCGGDKYPARLPRNASATAEALKLCGRCSSSHFEMQSSFSDPSAPP